MKDEITLGSIISEILKELGQDDQQSVDSLSVAMRRGFSKFLKMIGGDVELLKNDKKRIEFTKEEKPVIKKILFEVYQKQGIIFDYMNKYKKNETMSARELQEFIQEVIDEADRANFAEVELEGICEFLATVLRYPQKYIIERCHDWIDGLAVNLSDLTYNQQIAYLSDIDKKLKNEFVRRAVESVINIDNIAETLELAKSLYGEEEVQTYCGYDPEVSYEYMQRDKEILDRIKYDDDLRQYIEKKLGKKAEEIFAYAALDK